jgi:hypothetical protein
MRNLSWLSSRTHAKAGIRTGVRRFADAHSFGIRYLQFAKRLFLKLSPLLFAICYLLCEALPDISQRMRLEIDDLPETAFWRIYCRAIENGRNVNAEIVATLNVGHSNVPADVNARLKAARRLRKQARPASQ